MARDKERDAKDAGNGEAFGILLDRLTQTVKAGEKLARHLRWERDRCDNGDDCECPHIDDMLDEWGAMVPTKGWGLVPGPDGEPVFGEYEVEE